MYRPPNTADCSVSQFLDQFSEIVSYLNITNERLLIAGDFNFHIDDPTNNDATAFLQTVNSLNLIQHVDGPTHSHEHTLDLLMTCEGEDTIFGCPVIDDEI